MRQIQLIIALIFCSIWVNASSPTENMVNNALLDNANISLMVSDLKTGETLYSIRPTHSAMPASTMKLITTATALEILGKDFRFKTDLLINGKVSADSTLDGDIIISGGGDPTLGSSRMGDSDFLNKWALAVKKAGIKKVNGGIIADEAMFDHEGVNPAWLWDDMGNYYAAGAYGLAYLDNQFQLVLKSNAPGTRPSILRTIPEIPELEFDNQLTCGNINFDSAFFHAAPKSNLRSIYGKIPANKAEFIVKGDIPNPSLLLAKHFQSQLSGLGIEVKGLPRVNSDTLMKGDTIFRMYSPPLKEIITETNVKSNNLYAEHLFRFLGSTKARQGNAASAIKVIKEYWKDNGLSTDQLFLNDGSGLSPADGVSAKFYVDLLTYMRTKSKNDSTFYHSLPVAGESGTLKNFLKNTALQGKVHAKSGTIARVKCYAGYLETSTQSLAFAILINNSNGNYKAVTQKMEDFLLEISTATHHSPHKKRNK
jgi:serine-type D-Ala-D-Ala carboxypeptidase/endopeptidase (penicillin-binding protein 4)